MFSTVTKEISSNLIWFTVYRYSKLKRSFIIFSLKGSSNSTVLVKISKKFFSIFFLQCSITELLSHSKKLQIKYIYLLNPNSSEGSSLNILCKIGIPTDKFSNSKKSSIFFFSLILINSSWSRVTLSLFPFNPSKWYKDEFLSMTLLFPKKANL